MSLSPRFVPGNTDTRFCKPSAVAVLSNGDFFVADGYCNHRVIKFSPDGTILLQWGTGKWKIWFLKGVFFFISNESYSYSES